MPRKPTTSKSTHTLPESTTQMSLLAPPNIHGCCTLPIAPTINILHAIPIDHTSINAILRDILTHKMPPLPVLHDDHDSHPPINSTTSTKLEGRTFQANATIIATWFKIIPYKMHPLIHQRWSHPQYIHNTHPHAQHIPLILTHHCPR